MEVFISPGSIFILGAFTGALFGRLVTFGVMALCLVVMLILKY